MKTEAATWSKVADKQRQLLVRSQLVSCALKSSLSHLLESASMTVSTII